MAAALHLNSVASGSGPTVVLLHGFPEYWYSWRKQIPALNAAGFRTVAVDLPGYNDSEKPREVIAYRQSNVVNEIAALVQRLGAPVRLVGHDWGALASWFLAMMRPELVSRLAILNVPHPAAFAREMRRSRKQRLLMTYQLLFQPPIVPELMMRALLPWFMRRAGRFTPEDIAEYRKSWAKPGALRAMANYYRAMFRYRGDLKALIAPIDIPTLVIAADHEPVFNREAFENTEEWVPKTRVARVSRAGHFVQTDQPEEVNRLLIDFFR
jgi:pimeloyl-ACP methyl ester carboxylesterase